MSISFGEIPTYEQVQLGYRISMFALWGFGVELPRIVLRYGKAYPQSMNIHSISMLIISLMTIMYVIARSVSYYSQN